MSTIHHNPGELAELLGVVREAIAIPLAASGVAELTRAQLLTDRASYAAVALTMVYEFYEPVPRAIEWLRDQLGKHPAEGQYATWNEYVADLRRSRDEEAGQ